MSLVTTFRLDSRYLLITSLLCLVLFGPAAAQVSVQMSSNSLIINNKGFGPQQAVRANADGIVRALTAGAETGSDWILLDNVGNTYEKGRDIPKQPEVIVVGGYQRTKGRDVPKQDEVILIGGYQEVLQYLEDQYGAEVEHDSDIDADLIQFPGEDDPITTFFTIIVSDSLYGHPLIDFFSLIEIASEGDFDYPAYDPVTPAGKPLSFPNDTYFQNEWNLISSGIVGAQWYPVRARKSVKIGVIDSGIRTTELSHGGLDGTAVVHSPIAPTTGLANDHALGIVTLLGDRSQDNSGIVSLLSDQWTSAPCGLQPLLASNPPQIISYNVGDFGPISTFVAKAIYQAIEDKVDVINLSLALPYSPIVEEAILEAIDQKIVVVAAAGNYESSVSNKPAKFPANIDGVISVGSAGSNLKVSPTSACSGLDILAPGDGIIVGGFNNVWYSADGTSFAAPHVTATVAFMRAVNPTLTPAAIAKNLTKTAVFSGKKQTTGFLNALGSVTRSLSAGTKVSLPRITGECLLQLGTLASELIKSGVFFDEQLSEGSLQSDLETLAGYEQELPTEAAILDNYPNPFNPATTIRFAVPEQQLVRLAVFNVLGQNVTTLMDGVVEAGVHQVSFDASTLPNGVYIARMETQSGVVSVRSLILAK